MPQATKAKPAKKGGARSGSGRGSKGKKKTKGSKDKPQQQQQQPSEGGADYDTELVANAEQAGRDLGGGRLDTPPKVFRVASPNADALAQADAASSDAEAPTKLPPQVQSVFDSMFDQNKECVGLPVPHLRSPRRT